LYTDDELGNYGFAAFHLGESADGAIVQTDHTAYASLQPSDLPGMKAIIDGRNILGAAVKAAISVTTIGAPSPSSMTVQ
jgi:UDP-N-acetyl-D-mannosaminuronate dehydrogenase